MAHDPPHVYLRAMPDPQAPRDPRRDPQQGDVLERPGRRHLALRRFVTGREGMAVHYTAGDGEAPLTTWLSTWMDWCANAEAAVVHPSVRHPPFPTPTDHTMPTIKLGAYTMKRDGHGWQLEERRPSDNPAALRKNPDAHSVRNSYYASLGGCLDAVLDREAGKLEGQDAATLAAALRTIRDEIMEAALRLEALPRARPRPRAMTGRPVEAPDTK